VPKPTSHARHLAPPLVYIGLLVILAAALTWLSTLSRGNALETPAIADNGLPLGAGELRCAAIPEATARTTCQAIIRDTPELCAELTDPTASSACQDEFYFSLARTTGDSVNCKFITKQVLRTKCNTRIGTD
jgi:hypothetical protein